MHSVPNEVVHKSQKHELIWFRLLNSSVFKNDSTLITSTRTLFQTQGKFLILTIWHVTGAVCRELRRDSVNSWRCHGELNAPCCLGFKWLPAQIAKACEHLLPKLFSSLEARITNWMVLHFTSQTNSCCDGAR